MTDRELLELAAKAAGIECWRTFIDEKWGSGFLMAGKLWNPLTDDGDALRLAVQLELDIEIYKTSTHVYDDRSEKTFEEDHDGDPYAATRRAIVRAAAALGADK